MGKLDPKEIEKSDIEEYLHKYSDFSFELKVLEKFNALGFRCDHSGTYEDPITGITRQFDIRAFHERKLISVNLWARNYLSVECKNLQSNFPLLVHSLKRKRDESFHDVIFTSGDSSLGLKHEKKKITDDKSLYSMDQYVAKATDQIGRHANTREILSNDNDLFAKISQAINSAKDLIQECLLTPKPSERVLSFICPVVIIPDDTLWEVEYKVDGYPEEAKKCKRASLYIGKEWTVNPPLQYPQLTYNMSHLEIATISGISDFVSDLLDDDLWMEF